MYVYSPSVLEGEEDTEKQRILLTWGGGCGIRDVPIKQKIKKKKGKKKDGTFHSRDSVSSLFIHHSLHHKGVYTKAQLSQLYHKRTISQSQSI